MLAYMHEILGTVELKAKSQVWDPYQLTFGIIFVRSSQRGGSITLSRKA